MLCLVCSLTKKKYMKNSFFRLFSLNRFSNKKNLESKYNLPWPTWDNFAYENNQRVAMAYMRHMKITKELKMCCFWKGDFFIKLINVSQMIFSPMFKLKTVRKVNMVSWQSLLVKFTSKKSMKCSLAWISAELILMIVHTRKYFSVKRTRQVRFWVGSSTNIPVLHTRFTIFFFFLITTLEINFYIQTSNTNWTILISSILKEICCMVLQPIESKQTNRYPFGLYICIWTCLEM